MKKVNAGSDLLIAKNKWVPEKEIQGTDEMVLMHPMMEEAFQNIVKLHRPKHKVALVSLCTSTRPYSKSRKWKEFARLFGADADLIICSNGGIIPIEFENCYPYLTYDAHGQKKYDQLYCRVVYRRLMEFFGAHRYERIVFNFRPGLRNRASALKFKQMYDGKTEVFILPTQGGYKAAQRRGFPSGKMYPDLDKVVIDELSQAIYKNKK